MSTSLSDLPLPGGGMQDLSGGAQQNFDLNSMIDEAAKQVKAGTYQNDGPSLSAGAIQYQLDASQIPQNGPNPNVQMQQEQQYMGDDMQMEQPQYMYDMSYPEPELSLTDKILNQIKLPLIVAVLFVILSIPQFNRVLTRFVPRFLAETGELNMMGLFAKAIVLAILLVGVRYFL
jgi:hypothetical protein